MAWREAISLDELQPGCVKRAGIGDTPIALYPVGDEVVATHGVCTHALAFLAEGFLEDGKIECPLHQGQFDIRTGKALCAPLTKDIQTFAVKIDGGKVFVDLDRPATASPEPKAEEAGTIPNLPDKDPVIVVGGGQAAAAAIRALRSSQWTGPIVLVGGEKHLPYERPPLSKDVLLGKAAIESCTRLSASDIEEQ